MDSEFLKNEYSRNFAQASDKWSVTKKNATDRTVKKMTEYLITKGFEMNPKPSMLDVGCAKGHFTNSFNDRGYNANGLDYSDQAIKLAIENFRGCHFFIMDGFKPELTEKYNLIFMRGFSGTNTHDLPFVAEMITRYADALKENGWFALGYSTNYSGVELGDETANWTKEEMQTLSGMLPNLKLVGIKQFDHAFPRRIYRAIINAFGMKRKTFFYLMYQKQN